MSAQLNLSTWKSSKHAPASKSGGGQDCPVYPTLVPNVSASSFPAKLRRRMDFWGYTSLQSTGVANFNIPAKVMQLIKTCDFFTCQLACVVYWQLQKLSSWRSHQKQTLDLHKSLTVPRQKHNQWDRRLKHYASCVIDGDVFGCYVQGPDYIWALVKLFSPLFFVAFYKVNQ
jgi:hypothetical protein